MLLITTTDFLMGSWQGGQACGVPREVPGPGHRLLLLHVVRSTHHLHLSTHPHRYLFVTCLMRQVLLQVLPQRHIQHPQQEDLQLLPLSIVSTKYAALDSQVTNNNIQCSCCFLFYRQVVIYDGIPCHLLQLCVLDPSSSGCCILPRQLESRSPQASGNFYCKPAPLPLPL